MRLDFLVPVFGILLLMIPVLGLTTIATLRWGLMPFMERLAKELEGSELVVSKALEGRVEELTRQVEEVTGELRRLQEAQDFDRKLLSSKTRPSEDPAGDGAVRRDQAAETAERGDGGERGRELSAR